MNLQVERIREKCESLRLKGMLSEFEHLSERAAKEELGYAEYFEKLLDMEIASKDERSKSTMLRMSGLPSIKSIDSFDFNHSTGISRKQITELSSLAFVDRAENLVLLGPSGVGNYVKFLVM